MRLKWETRARQQLTTKWEGKLVAKFTLRVMNTLCVYIEMQRFAHSQSSVSKVLLVCTKIQNNSWHFSCIRANKIKI